MPAWDRAPDGPDAGPRHVLRREYFGSLVYDRETCSYVPYDDRATALLLERLDGPAEPAGGAEAGFVRALQAEGLLDPQGRLDARLVPDRAAHDRLSAPLTVYLGAAQGCNLACTHCQAGSGPGPLGAVPDELMRRLFTEMRDLGCGLLHVTGGEPLLHPELLDALGDAFRLGLNVLLTTNGTLVTEALAERLAGLPLRCLSVSLDGPDEATHDRIRGPGALERALAGLRRLAARRPVGVTTTYTPGLLPRLEALVRLVERSGAASLTLRPALPAGRATLAHTPTQAEFGDACALLDRLQPAASIPLFHPPEVPHQATTAFVLERFGCVAGNLVCSVTPTGMVSPCALLGPSFDAGSLHERSLHDLWVSGPSFVRLRALEGNPTCWSCRHYDHCGGGCRARTLAHGGALDAPDPWCRYEAIAPGSSSAPLADGPERLACALDEPAS